MKARLLAGSFDPERRGRSDRLGRALAPHATTHLDRGALQVAFTGEPAPPGELVCLLAGFLDDLVELADALHAPASTPAEELLAIGYRRWGSGLLPRLRGDFVLLLWDGAEGQGLIARDQLGVRCIYLSEAGGRLSFAGEIHQLLALLPSRPSPDPVSVAHLIALSGRPGSATVFAGVRRLNPGSVLLLDRHGAREERYWTPRFTESLPLGAQDLAAQVRTGLERAVSRRIAGEGETAVLMSGGLDSGAVASLTAAQVPGRVSAYAGVFPAHPAVDESSLIAELRRALELDGLDVEVRPGGLLASALESQQRWQVPLLGWGDFWTLPLLRAAASNGVTVALGGDGGDELFGARSYLLADSFRRGRPDRALRQAREMPGAGDHPSRRRLARILADVGLAGALPPVAQHQLWRAFKPQRLPRWMRAQTRRDLVDSDDPYAWKRLDGPRWWTHAAHGLTRGVEEVGIFEHNRRRAALAGLEHRHPLFDLDLLELALRQPPEATFDRDRNRPVLRASLAGLLPDSIRLRPAKAWFDSLITDCLCGADAALVRAIVTSPTAELGAYLDIDGVARALFDDHRGPGRSFQWMHQLWRLLSIECWLRSECDPGGPDVLGGLAPSAASLRFRIRRRAHRSDRYIFPP